MSSGNSYLKNLKMFRNKKGWTREKLAREANVSYHTIIKIERGGIKNPRLDTLIKLAKALGVSLDKLVSSQK
jgi:transcriptional regulator with XRE-family HTH domain